MLHAFMKKFMAQKYLINLFSSISSSFLNISYVLNELGYGEFTKNVSYLVD
jgi:hypothetical protein